MNISKIILFTAVSMPIHVSPSIRMPISHNSYTFPTQAARPIKGRALLNRHITLVEDYYIIRSRWAID